MSISPAPARKKETVIIVHGTFAAPKDQTTNWYQCPRRLENNTNFVTKLDAALKRKGSAARCWAHCQNDNEIFSWSGKNDWAERARAAEALTAIVNGLEHDGWACHLIAHSHGGNIVADALPHIREVTGSLTTLGTPFLDARTPVTNRLARSARFFYSISLVAPILYGSVGLGVYAAAVALPILAIIWLDMPWRLWQPIRRQLRRRKRIAKGRSVRMLCMNSDFDEAWQLLYHVRRTVNPLQPKHRLIGHLFDHLREFNDSDGKVARLHGARCHFDADVKAHIRLSFATLGLVAITVGALASFASPQVLSSPLQELVSGLIGGEGLLANLAAMLAWVAAMLVVWLVVILYILSDDPKSFSAAVLPFRWSWRQMRAIGRIPSALGTYVVRQRAWPLLCDTLLGFRSFPYTSPQVTRTPAHIKDDDIRYEAIPRDAELAALAQRDQWLISCFGVATETFGKIALTSADLEALLRQIETDATLVHAAYYTDEKCIERIADWIVHQA